MFMASADYYHLDCEGALFIVLQSRVEKLLGLQGIERTYSVDLNSHLSFSCTDAALCHVHQIRKVTIMGVAMAERS